MVEIEKLSLWDPQLQKERSFIGQGALQQQANEGLRRQLVFFQLEGHDPERDLWAWGQEPLFCNGHFVGMTSSGSYAFSLGRNVCQGMVHWFDPESRQLQLLPPNLVSEGHFEVGHHGKRASGIGNGAHLVLGCTNG